MKIGVIGLLADQANSVRRMFPEHDLEFLSKERERDAATFAARCTKVVVMTKFIGHSTEAGVPLHKRIRITGGTTKLGQWLNTQPTAPKVLVAPPRKEPVMHIESKIDYQILLTVPVGEIVVWKRPAKIGQERWEKQISASRSYYRRQHGVETKIKFVDGTAEIQVVKRHVEPAAAELPAATEHVEPVVVTVAASNRDERRFWQQCLVARLQTALPMVNALQDADAALEAYRAKFNQE